LPEYIAGEGEMEVRLYRGAYKRAEILRQNDIHHGDTETRRKAKSKA